jgi:hypothetical protein
VRQFWRLLSRRISGHAYAWSVPPYRRKPGIIYSRPNIGAGRGAPILDGGHDAPLSRRGKLAFRLTLLGILVLGAALITLAALSR